MEFMTPFLMAVLPIASDERVILAPTAVGAGK